MIPAWPSSDMEDAVALMGAPGSFWVSHGQDRDFMLGLATSSAILRAEANQHLQETMLALSVHSVPIFRKRIIYPFWVRSSDRNSDESAVPLYGDGWMYGDPIQYGRAASTGTFSYLAPPGLVSVSAISGRISDSQVTWISGVDFWVKNGRIIFSADPLTSPGFTVRRAADGSDAVDGVMYLIDAEFDTGRIGNKYGVLVPGAASSEAWRSLASGIMAATVRGPSMQRVRSIVSDIYGIPVANQSGTVRKIFDSLSGVWVATDDDVYAYPAGSVPSVSVGDDVEPGDTLVDGIVIVDGSASSDSLEDFGPLTLRSSFAPGALTFVSTPVPVEYCGIRGGRAEVRFRVDGAPEVVSAFWDGVHAFGLASGRTVADFLDTRQAGNGEPLPQHLPATVVPAEIIQAILGLVLIRVDSSVSRGGLGSMALSALQKTLPPHAGIVLNIWTTALSISGQASDQVIQVGIAPEIPDSTGSGFGRIVTAGTR